MIFIVISVYYLAGYFVGDILIITLVPITLARLCTGLYIRSLNNQQNRFENSNTHRREIEDARKRRERERIDALYRGQEAECLAIVSLVLLQEKVSIYCTVRKIDRAWYRAT